MESTRSASTLMLKFVAVCGLVFLADESHGGDIVKRIFFEHTAAPVTVTSHHHHAATPSHPVKSHHAITPHDAVTPLVIATPLDAFTAEDAELEAMKKRLAPRQLLFVNSSSNELQHHQFLHLHHMKTGGTSMDGLIGCGMSRLRAIHMKLNYTNLHECGQSHYAKCVSGESKGCLKGVQNAAVMSYCAPLKDLSTPFQWLDKQLDPSTDTQNPDSLIHAAVTVFRHPVGRVWSMFRFQTKSCYKCRNLADIYADLDAGNDADISSMCRSQLLNHQTRNLLSKAPEHENPSSDAHAQEAINNMKSVFTMIGITEDMPATAAIAGKVFPWLAEQVQWDDAIGSHTNGVNTTKGQGSCLIKHKNASPKNNRCGADGKSHWDLPDKPDEETIRLIMEHNQQDVKLYEAAMKQFALQKKALGL